MTNPYQPPKAEIRGEMRGGLIGSYLRGANWLKKMTQNNVLIVFIFSGLVLSQTICAADDPDSSLLVESKPISEFWLTPGFYSYHFERNASLNARNLGLGGEFRFSTVSTLAAGGFQNSVWRLSRYATCVWQPLAMGPVRLGAAFGVIDGYPKMNNGDWFPAAVPVVSFEYKSIGANLILIPAYRDKLYSTLSLQMKLKLF